MKKSLKLKDIKNVKEVDIKQLRAIKGGEIDPSGEYAQITAYFRLPID